jgi:hypothetical protein
MITYNSIGKYGRFGNQMFQYSTLFAIAKERGYEFGVPHQLKSDNEYLNFCLLECFSNLSAKDSTNIKNVNKAQERQFTYNPGIFGISNNTDICGYFQSEKYFINYREQLLIEYNFNKDIQQKAFDMRSLTKNKAISIHLRLGDYLNLQDCHPVCSIEYYQEALKMLPDDLLIYVFSDDIEKATKFFDFINRKVVFTETSDKYVDMCLMTMCDYHIIANSSFSWWGAWLSNSKKVIAPSKWFGDNPNMPKDWSDIYCSNWNII